MVFSFVETEKQTTAIGKFMVHLGIDIIEIVIVFFVLRKEWPCYQVKIGATAGQTKGCLIFQDRTFEV